MINMLVKFRLEIPSDCCNYGNMPKIFGDTFCRILYTIIIIIFYWM